MFAPSNTSAAYRRIRATVCSSVSLLVLILQTISSRAWLEKYTSSEIRFRKFFVCSSFCMFFRLSSERILMFVNVEPISSCRSAAIRLRTFCNAINWLIRYLYRQYRIPNIAIQLKPINHHVRQNGGSIIIVKVVMGSILEARLFEAFTL